VGPKAGLDTVVKRKIPSPCRDSNLPIFQLVAQRYTTKITRFHLKTLVPMTLINGFASNNLSLKLYL
jgi:hypothetical protein